MLITPALGKWRQWFLQTLVSQPSHMSSGPKKRAHLKRPRGKVPKEKHLRLMISDLNTHTRATEHIFSMCVCYSGERFLYYLHHSFFFSDFTQSSWTLAITNKENPGHIDIKIDIDIDRYIFRIGRKLCLGKG